MIRRLFTWLEPLAVFALVLAIGFVFVVFVVQSWR